MIPFKSLRYQPGREQIWGINLRRTIRGEERVRLHHAAQARMGRRRVLPGVGGRDAGRPRGAARPAKNLEIKPYAISRLTTDLLASPAVRNDWSPDAGVDVKYGVTKSLTADFTYNTDFAQVEEDEAQVNLTRFNLLFPEKREFFLEGQGIFTFGGRLGGGRRAAMRRRSSTAAASACRAPRAVPIIGGGRLIGTGRPVQHRRAQHRDRRRRRRRRAGDELHGRPRAPRHAAAQHHRRALHEPVGLDAWRPAPTRCSASTPTSRFYQNVCIGGYAAQSRTERRVGRRDSATARNFNYTADRYGLQLDRTVVGDNFNPEVGFLRREDFRRNFASARFSPRPATERRRSASVFYEAASTTSPTTRTGSSRATLGASARMSCRTATRSTSSTTGNTSCCAGRSSPPPASSIPPGALCVSARPRLVDAGPAAPAVRALRRRRRRVLRRHQEDRVGQRAVRRDRSVRASSRTSR